jgi:hypothetical protein
MQLSADKDLNVKNGAQLLDRLIKDIVTESDAFDIERYVCSSPDCVYGLQWSKAVTHLIIGSRVVNPFLIAIGDATGSCHCSRNGFR